MPKIISFTVEQIISAEENRGLIKVRLDSSDHDNPPILIMSNQVDWVVGTAYKSKVLEEFELKDIKYKIHTAVEIKVLNKQIQFIVKELDERLKEKATAILSHYLLEDGKRELLKSNISQEIISSIISRIEKVDNDNWIKAFLSKFEIPNKNIKKIIAEYGNQLITRPYYLIQWGIKAEKIICELKLEERLTQELYIQTLIMDVVNTECNKKYHTYVEMNEFLENVKELAQNEQIFELSETAINEALQAISDYIICEQLEDGTKVICFKKYWDMEVEVANMLIKIVQAKLHIQPEVVDYVIKCTKSEAIKEHRVAIRKALLNNITIINGGAGTGKTTVLKKIFNVFKEMYPDAKVNLVAPTGKAVTRAKEATEIHGDTIHKLLRLGTKDEKNDLHIKSDMLIIDEAGMLDLEIFCKLMKAFYKNTNIRIVIVGDAYQLPPIGVGQVFIDLISAECIPITELIVPLRQKSESVIIKNAHMIKNAETDIIWNTEAFQFVQTESSMLYEKATDVLNKLIKKENIEEIQVLSTLREYAYGSKMLNEKIAGEINPFAERIFYRLCVMDKVIQTINNYKNNVFNGEIGTIIETEESSGQFKIKVEYQNRGEDPIIEYVNKECGELELSFATTIHKMQGSSTKIIVLIIPKEHKNYINRNLLYVAVTRAQEKVIILGDKETFIAGIKKEAQIRNSALLEKIMSF